jgi:hypothetical protein
MDDKIYILKGQKRLIPHASKCGPHPSSLSSLALKPVQVMKKYAMKMVFHTYTRQLNGVIFTP